MSLSPRLKGVSYGTNFAVAVIVMCVVTLFFFRGQNEIKDALRWRAHTIEVLLELEGLAVDVSDAQAGSRGFVITGTESFLSNFRRAHETAPERIRHLKALVADNVIQNQRALDLSPIADELMRFNTLLVEERTNGGMESAVALINSGRGEELGTRVRGMIRELEDEERRLLSAREKRMEDGLDQVRLIFLVGVGVAGLIIAWAGWLMKGTIQALRTTMVRISDNEWLQTHLAKFNALIQGNKNPQTLLDRVLGHMAGLLENRHGVFYIARERDGEIRLEKLSGYAIDDTRTRDSWGFGEGLVGQCAKDHKRLLLNDVPSEYMRVKSGLGESAPRALAVVPVVFEKRILGVLEIAWLSAPSDLKVQLLDALSEPLGVALHTIQSHEKTDDLLRNTRALAAELEAQQEQLQKTNQELHSQADELRRSQDLLREQQSELETINIELEEKAVQLEAQRSAAAGKNKELELAQAQLSDRAEQLALTSKYKSEFLANMSHELRTPLNSLMLLSRLLAENRDGNLSAKQVQYLQTIENSGHDLLTLINDILDLARIEAGRLNFTPEKVTVAEIRSALEQTFLPLADQKRLGFTVRIGPNVPESITTDSHRVQQILRNLLSNALKFTMRGNVTLDVTVAEPHPGQPERLAWAVQDTGIGIPQAKQRLIWEAFQQADGNTTRKFGGTGLGLTISRELASRLGGEITLASEEGHGSTFTLYLPTQYVGPMSGEDGTATEASDTPPRKETLPPFAAGAPVALAASGRSGRVLVIEDDEIERDEISRLLSARGAEVTTVQSGRDALAALRGERFECVILDLKLPDVGGLDLLDRMRGDLGLRETPVIVNTGRILSSAEETRLQRFVHAVVVKGPKSLGRLVDEAMVFLGRERPAPSGGSRSPIPLPAESSEGFVGRKVLIVDDDLRNIFATTSVLESHEMVVAFAENGRDALKILEETPGIEIVLMDIMMPEMDGYETTRRIRKDERFQSLPIIALTAKAMAGDREKCIEAGASDYLSKPVEMDRLLTLMRVWLNRRATP